MADEAQVNSSFYIKKGSVDYRSYPTSFKDTVSGDAKGPTPGAVTATVAGINVSLAELTTPGLCRIRNLDASNTVHYGIHDGSNFFPFGQVGPGQHVDFKFSSFFGDILGTTGTGDAGDCSLRVLAENESCDVTVEAFEA